MAYAMNFQRLSLKPVKKLTLTEINKRVKENQTENVCYKVDIHWSRESPELNL